MTKNVNEKQNTYGLLDPVILQCLDFTHREEIMKHLRRVAQSIFKYVNITLVV